VSGADLTRVDLQKLRGAKCGCCGKNPSEEHPIIMAQLCHPATGLRAVYQGGDRVMMFCLACNAFVFEIVVGESAGVPL
jgi:hypothetical protein